MIEKIIFSNRRKEQNSSKQQFPREGAISFKEM